MKVHLILFELCNFFFFKLLYLVQKLVRVEHCMYVVVSVFISACVVSFLFRFLEFILIFINFFIQTCFLAVNIYCMDCHDASYIFCVLIMYGLRWCIICLLFASVWVFCFRITLFFSVLRTQWIKDLYCGCSALNAFKRNLAIIVKKRIKLMFIDKLICL